MPEITMQTVLDEMRTTHEALKTHVDNQIKEVKANGETTALTNEAIDKINGDLTELRTKYDEMVLANQRPSGIAANGGDNGGDNASDIELRHKAFGKFLRHGAGENTTLTVDEKRVLSSASDAEGGFLVPPDWENELLVQAYDESAIRPLVNAKPTSRDTVFLPALSKPSVSWGTVNVAVSAQDLDAGGERISIYDLKALALIHNNTLDDAAANIWGELMDMFSMAVSEAEDDAYAIGVGNNSPSGIVSDSRVQAINTVTGVAADISDGSNNGVDAMIDVLYTLKKIYRRNATWAMNSQTEAATRKLKDGDGQYLWQPPVQAGAPTTLLGRPVVNPEGMPDIGAGTYPIVVGDFAKGYKIRDRSGIAVQRLVERYAEYDQTGFLLKRRTGGQVTMAEAFSCLKVSA